ncbi:MAG: hypothetical protein JWQ28_1345 [Pedobacter sp.]|jgi:hypothetical protein|nr:hypothetical protein [Pedobacter sp.]
MLISRVVYTIIILGWVCLSSVAQTTTTVVPFLNLMPDARASAMGDAGVAMQPDANSISINASKLVFIPQRFGFSASYSPWLKSLAPDMNLSYLSAFIKPDEKSGLAASMRYFSLGSIQYTGQDRQDLGSYKPVQLALDAAYSRKLGDNLSIGTAFRYIVSTGYASRLEGSESIPAIKAVAADVSAYYVQPVLLFGSEATISAGLNLSNIARAIKFKNDANTYYLPTNIKLGTAASFQLDDVNEFSFAVDLNQLLNPPQYMNAGLAKTYSNKPAALKKITLGGGFEYLYDKQFAVRAGYLYENPQVGDRRYPTLGAGFKFNMLNLDVSYLAASIQKSPLAGSLRFTLMFTFDQE